MTEKDYEDNPAALKLLENLNEQQKKAVLANDKPLVVFAGAGSGKTRVITTKLAWCIRILGIPSWKILAVTFTNKACKEMRDRVQKVLPEVGEKDLCIKTFHAFGAMVLRRYGELIHLNKNFKIYDDDDSVALLCQIFPNDKRTDLVPIAKKISICKDKMIMPEETKKGRDTEFYRYYSRYQDALLSTGNVDFADLITRTIELIDSCDEVQDWLHHRFKVVLVDEYQDSNAAQCQLLRRIVGPGCFVCVVGDDDQSIYRFRGAEVQNILNFGDYFPGAEVIKLEQNYRSTKSIINLASSVIEKNRERVKKHIFTQREDGNMPQLFYVDSEYAEAYFVASVLQKDGAYDSSAVLYRTNAQSATFESTFNKLKIPYKLVGALRFYAREEVKDVIAYLGIIMNPLDSVSFGRIINKPLRGIGNTSAANLVEASANYGGDLIVTSREVLKGSADFKVSGTKGLQSFINAYEKIQAMIGVKNNSEVIKAIVKEFGLDNYYADRDVKEKNIDSKRVKNIEQVVNIISDREDFQDGIEGFNAFIEEASLDPTMMASDENMKPGGVTLITMHNTKGLEFDRVFISGMEEGLFPSPKTESEADLEEERRIFYVAITRARNDLYIFSCNQRKIWGSTHSQLPSRFLSELPKDLIKTNKSKSDPLIGGSSYSWSRVAPKPKTFTYQSYSSYKPTPKPTTPSALLSRAPAETPSPVKKQAETVLPKQDFSEGDIVLSENYGQGTVTAIRNFGTRRVFDVKFDDGRRASFVEGKANLRKI